MRRLPLEFLAEIDRALSVHAAILGYTKTILLADVQAAADLLCAGMSAQLANAHINMQSRPGSDDREVYRKAVVKYSEALKGHIDRTARAAAERCADDAEDRKGNG